MGKEVIDRIVVEALDRCCSAVDSDWNRRELNAYVWLSGVLQERHEITISQCDMYYGGDALRPYLSVNIGDTIQIVSIESVALSQPRLLQQADAEDFGKLEKSVLPLRQTNYTLRALRKSDLLAERLAVPKVLLAGMTNAARYQSRRYPLNIARLAQWLRFQHVGRVEAFDLALDFNGDVSRFLQHLTSARPDVLGLSVNLGENPTLSAVIHELKRSGIKPILCLGNVLAAWDRTTKGECEGFDYHIADSYGEEHLERVCISFRCQTQLTCHKDKPRPRIALKKGPKPPSAIIFPDERLLMDTIRQGGQVSIETSFGCQYARCSFCPRDHRGRGWWRPNIYDAQAVIGRMALILRNCSGGRGSVLSIVDEDAFGNEGRGGAGTEPGIVSLVKRAAAEGSKVEIYTRLDQIFDATWERHFISNRLRQWMAIQPALSRVFVGVESGCDSQLGRYGKGHSLKGVVASLRVGSLLGLPLEFGFITFDPLLTQSELISNILFLSRRDVLQTEMRERGDNRIDLIVEYAENPKAAAGEPVYAHVAYMATELEVFANSGYAQMLQKRHPTLLGPYDSGFSRFRYNYEDPCIETIAGLCRVWTEGTFAAIYKLRLAARTVEQLRRSCAGVISRHRTATFWLLTELTATFIDEGTDFIRPLIEIGSCAATTGGKLPADWLPVMEDLWAWVGEEDGARVLSEQIKFDIRVIGGRRDN